MKNKTKCRIWHWTSTLVISYTSNTIQTILMQFFVCYCFQSVTYTKFVVISVQLSRSKPSVNEHMIQICHFGLVFSPSCFHAHRIFTALSLSSWIEYGTIRVRCGTHDAGKLLWFFHLDTHLLLIKLKLDGNYCWLFWYGFRHKSMATGRLFYM